MLQDIGRVATLKLVTRNWNLYLRYLQTTLIMGEGGIGLRIYVRYCSLTEETDKGTSSKEESSSDSGSESVSDSRSDSDSWSKSPFEPDILSGKSSALPSQNNLLESRKDEVAPKKTSL